MATIPDLEKMSSIQQVEKANSIIRVNVARTDQLVTLEDKATEKRLVRKIDAVFIPVFAACYLVAYLDRNNIGNAKIMSFQKDLRMTNHQFYTCVLMFYAGYLTGIFPGNLLLRIIGPGRHLGGCVVFFGLMATCMSVAKSYSTIMGLRFALGVAEAFLQSTSLYLSTWYRRDEIGSRVAIFYSATTLSGVFSGLIAYGVQKDLDGVGGRHAWQWFFIIEGIAAIGFGLITWLLLPPTPDKIKKSWLLEPDEIEVAIQRYKFHNHTDTKFELRQVWSSLLDPKTYLNAFLSAAASLILAAVGAFLPSIVLSFGYTAVTAQLFTVIPYACAFFTMLGFGFATDHYHNKGYFLFAAFSICAIGLVILLANTGNNGANMVGACFLVMGGYPAAVLQIAWVQVNFCGFTKRAVSWGVCMLFGQGFSMLATQIYDDPPTYRKGHAVILGFVVWALINTALLHFIMKSQNKKRDEILSEYNRRGEEHEDFAKSLEDLGDLHISFRYVL